MEHHDHDPQIQPMKRQERPEALLAYAVFSISWNESMRTNLTRAPIKARSKNVKAGSFSSRASQLLQGTDRWLGPVLCFPIPLSHGSQSSVYLSAICLRGLV